MPEPEGSRGGPPRSRGARRRRNSPTRTSPRRWTCSTASTSPVESARSRRSGTSRG